jgi:hypothetical protein
VDHTRWLHRPLPQSYLSYAGADVALIHALYDKFMQLRYITPALISQSELYITTWKHHQPASYETHLRHPLLPLGVLDPPDAPSSTIFVRYAVESLLEPPSPHLVGGSFHERRCWVCRAVAAKNNNRNHRRWEYDLEEYFDLIEEQDWDYDSGDYRDDIECLDYK